MASKFSFGEETLEIVRIKATSPGELDEAEAGLLFPIAVIVYGLCADLEDGRNFALRQKLRESGRVLVVH